MKITYLAHSGFLMEIEGYYLIFDYYRGELPEFPPESRVFVFVSHRHEDHFNPEILKLLEKYQVTFMFSYDISLKPYGMKKYGITEEMKQHIISMNAGARQTIEKIEIHTFKSSDEGVSFLVQVGNCGIYHAGDHNWWHWIGESKQYNNNMAAIYKRGIAQLKQVLQEKKLTLEVACIPLDPRLLQSYDYGMNYFLENIECAHVFPMHFSSNPSCVKEYLETHHTNHHVIGLDQEGMWVCF